jgi:uncharacterized protein (TIGR00255 family)
MTAYAGIEDELDGTSLAWEIRSVNHRYLDIALRLPDSLRFLEPDARNRIAAKLRRGRVECALNWRRTGGGSGTVNEPLVAALLSSAATVERLAGRELGSFSALDVLRWPGVIEDSEIDRDRLAEKILGLLDTALIRSVAARETEGNKLAALMEERLVRMDENLHRVTRRLPDVHRALRQKFENKLAELTANPDPDRLEQELVFWAQKLDVSEELDRLATHIGEFRRSLRQREPQGRRLDFLLQEMNREANTLASKSSDGETTAAAVEIKVLIEQIREQVQNVE